MAKKYYLDQEGLERLVQYINDALNHKADIGAIPADVALKSDLEGYVKTDDIGSYVDEDELIAELANVVRDSDIADVVRDSDIADVVRNADIADVVRSSDIADVVREDALDDYATNDDLDALKTSLATVYHYRGSVDNLEALQAVENPEIGDVYNIADTGMNAGWTGEVWDYFGSVVDLTDYLTEDEVNAIAIPTVDAILYGGKSAVISDENGLKVMLASDEPEVEAHLSENLVLDSYITVPAGKKLTLDLGGNKLSGNSYLINCAGGDIVLKNGEVESAGRPVYVSNGTVTLNGAEVTSTADVAISATGENAKVILESGKVTAQESGVLVTTGAKLEMNGGEIECWDNCPIQGNGSNGQGNVEVVMNGGKLKAHIQSNGYIACGVYMPNSGKFIMNGGEIESEGAGLVMRAGEVELNGGSIIATGATGVKGKVGDSKVTVGPYAVVYDESAKYPGASAGEFKLTIGKDMVLEGTDGDLDVLLSAGASANIVDNRA